MKKKKQEKPILNIENEIINPFSCEEGVKESDKVYRFDTKKLFEFRENKIIDRFKSLGNGR